MEQKKVDKVVRQLHDLPSNKMTLQASFDEAWLQLTLLLLFCKQNKFRLWDEGKGRLYAGVATNVATAVAAAERQGIGQQGCMMRYVM